MPSISNQHQQTAVMLTENGPFKDHLTLNVGEDLRICHFNIEGISKAKCEVLTKIMNKERIDVIALKYVYCNITIIIFIQCHVVRDYRIKM